MIQSIYTIYLLLYLVDEKNYYYQKCNNIKKIANIDYVI